MRVTPVPPGSMTCASSVTDLFDPIALAEATATADLQDRVDVKYIVTRETASAVLARLVATHRVLEIDGRRTFGYASTYHDTEDLRCARDHLQGRRRRFKCRVRHYADTDRRVVEVKLRGPRGRTVKHALETEVTGALDAPARAFVDAHVGAAYGFPPSAPLEPVVTTRYRRTTYVARDVPERLTVDLDLDLGAVRLAPEWVVLESKSTTGRGIADRLLREAGARPVERCSKFLLAVTSEHAGALPDNLVRPLLRRHFTATQQRSRPAADDIQRIRRSSQERRYRTSAS
jgi:hypothetical protein